MIDKQSIILPILAAAMIFGSHIDVGAKSFKYSKPNIVLIISDDQDNEHFGFMGNKTVRTPNLDKLAATGTVFSTCHLTSSRCRPSLAGLLSGRLPHQNGIYANFHIAKKKEKNGKPKVRRNSPMNALPKLLKEQACHLWLRQVLGRRRPRDGIHAWTRTGEAFREIRTKRSGRVSSLSSMSMRVRRRCSSGGRR